MTLAMMMVRATPILAIMTKSITFTGGSDDLIYLSLPTYTEEFHSSAGYKGILAASFFISSLSEGISLGFFKQFGLYVHALYDGSWSFAVSGGDDEYMPDWKIERSYGDVVSYSETLTIHVPDDFNWERIDE